MTVVPVFLALSALLGSGRQIMDFSNNLFNTFIAITGDAHQAKVAQDIFRQEVRYERSLQIREDIRDVNKMMLESVQTHLFMGSIILGICFTMMIEGTPPATVRRIILDLWLVFTGWSATFTLLSLWLALCFQAKISSCARERLLRKHRFQMPDDSLVGKMGGTNLVNQMATFHDKILSMMNGLAQNGEEEGEAFFYIKKHRDIRKKLRVCVEAADGRKLDVEPMRKGMHPWVHRNGRGYGRNTVLDLPTFLVGETLIRNKWLIRGDKPLHLRVQGEATMYIAAQCPPRDNSTQDDIRAALRLNGQIPAWPVDELPMCVSGYHEAWTGIHGFGEFRRVDGFSIFVDRANIELPLYKLVLKTPEDGSDGFVDVVVEWKFKKGCEALVVVCRKGQVHCKEEDWPIAEFNDEIKQIMPLRDYSGMFMNYGVSNLICGAFFTLLAKLDDIVRSRIAWGFEVALLILSLAPAMFAIFMVPIHIKGISNIVGADPTKDGLHHHGPVSDRDSRISVMSDATAIAMEEGREGDDDLLQSTTVDDQEIICTPDGQNDAGEESGPLQPEAEKQPKHVIWPSNLKDKLPPGLADAVQGCQSCRTCGRRDDKESSATSDRSPSKSKLVHALDQLGLKDLTDPTQVHTSMSQWCGNGSVERASSKQVVSAMPGPPATDQTCPENSGNDDEVIQTTENFEQQEERKSSKPSLSQSKSVAILMSEADEISSDSTILEETEPRWKQLKPSQMLKRMPSVMKPIDPNASLTVEGATAKALRSTLRKFRTWAATLKSLYCISLCLALVWPYSWIELFDDSPPKSAQTATKRRLSEVLVWSKWDLIWPPFFHPNAIAMDSSDEVLYAVSDNVLQILRSGGTDPPIVLPSPISGIGFTAPDKLVAIGDGTGFQVMLPGAEGANAQQRHSAHLLGPARHARATSSRPLPAELASPLAAVAVLSWGNTGEVAAIAVAAGPLSAPALSQGSGVHVYVSDTEAPHNVSLHHRALIEPIGAHLLRNVTALHACAAGICAKEPVLWAAAARSIFAVGLLSGQLLGFFEPPSSNGVNDKVRLALTGTTSKLVIVEFTEGHAPVAFFAPLPTLTEVGTPGEL